MATQQEINDFVEQIMPYFDPTPIVEDAVEQSWPRLDRGLSDSQDMRRFQHLRGIFGRGGQPYWLRNNGTVANTDGTNTKLLTVSTVTGTAESTLHGAFHMLREDLVLEFPPVSSNTLQHVVVEYDPVRAADGGDPMVAKVVTSLDTSQGKDHLLLWTVDRRPSQLLSNAPVTRYRPFVAPTTTYNWVSELPDPDTLLSGTVAIVRRDGQTLMSMQPSEPDENDNLATQARWQNLSDPAWTNLSLNTYYEAHGVANTPKIKRRGKRRELSGYVRRPDRRNLDTGWSEGWFIATIPSRDCPSRTWKFAVSGSGDSPSSIVAVAINPAGELRAYSGMRSSQFISLDGIFWDVD